MAPSLIEILEKKIINENRAIDNKTEKDDFQRSSFWVLTSNFTIP